MSHLAERFSPGSARRILALDGGGVRGLISLGILESVERELARRSPDPEQFVLSDYFDLVAGTSTGSIIAVGLAMGMKVEELARLYQTHSPRIFPKTRSKGLLKNKYDAAPLEKLLEQIVGDERLESRRLRTGLMICAKRMDTDSAWVLTNNPASKFWDCPNGSFYPNRLYSIRMLVRASTAAPTFFAPVLIDISSGEKGFQKEVGVFVDGAISGHNSPALQALLTATLPSYGFGWKSGAGNLLLISIGTGWRRTRRAPAAFLNLNPMGQGIAALQGLINDTVKNDLMVLQALSEPQRAWPINSEVSGLEGEMIAPAPLISFQRYDASLEEGPVVEALKIHKEKRNKRDKLVATLQDMAATGGDNIRACLTLGREAGKTVLASHFPAGFDIASESALPASQPVPSVSSRSIVSLGSEGQVLSCEKLTPDAFREAATLLGAPIGRYRKTMRVAALVATEARTVVTHWNGEETRNTAEAGDMLVTSLNADNSVARDQQGHANTYVMSAQRFAELYAPADLPAPEPGYGALHDPRGEVEAFAAGRGFEIVAPWGEIERAAKGYIVLNGADVYGVADELFRTTYAASGT